MLNRAARAINALLYDVNGALGALGFDRTIRFIPELDMARIENQFARAAERAGTAAREAFAGAFDTDAFEVPDTGIAERLETTEKTHDVQRQMLDAAARRPRDRDELADRLRDGEF